MKIVNMTPVSFENVKISRGFWKKRIDTIRNVTVQVCIDECERTHRIDNFRVAGGLKEGSFGGIYYNDSDVYKVLEGVAYTIANSHAPELEAKADEVIDAICAAQQPDGYLFTYFTLNTPENRWTDMAYHEGYCLGHMVEGAIAYAKATGKTKWLEAAKRAVLQMMSVNGPGKQHWVMGHQELELALIRLWRHTGEEAWLDYAKWLVEERGHKTFFTPEYCQDDVPVRELERVTGHAVRAMYYYTAITDLAAITGDQTLVPAVERLWNNVVPANMYLTGGIGQSAHNEGFTEDWSLPNLTAYCETCASIGMAYWNSRMSTLSGDSRYADIVELELYNGILSGISLSGDRFFYENPLASVGVHHRKPWYSTSCCPTNLIRFIPSVGGYVYAVSGDTVYVNQFIESDSDVMMQSGSMHIEMKTDYPWEGQVHLKVSGFEGERTLKIRKPGWCESAVLTVGQRDAGEADEGYFTATVRDGDELIYSMEMPVRRIHADERIAEDAGRVAVMRGPLVYCAEETDNPGLVREYFHAEKALSPDAKLKTGYETDLLDGVVVIEGDGIRLVPYYAWDNRNPGAMVVWMKEA